MLGRISTTSLFDSLDWAHASRGDALVIPEGGGGALHRDIKRYRQQDFRTLAVPEGRPSS
jgi:hypothetical protein